MKKSRFSIKEMVVVALIAAVICVIFTLLDWAYMPMSAVLGTAFMEITFGIYMLSPALPMYIVRNPGFGFFGAIVAAGVNLLLGSPYGLQLVLAGILEAAGIELAFLIFRYSGSLKCMVLGEILGAVFVFCRDTIFWGTPWNYGSVGVTVGTIVVRFLSAVIIGILLVKVITAALKKTGVLKGMACTKD